MLAAEWGLSWEIPLGVNYCELPDLHPQHPSEPMVIGVGTIHSTTEPFICIFHAYPMLFVRKKSPGIFEINTGISENASLPQAGWMSGLAQGFPARSLC